MSFLAELPGRIMDKLADLGDKIIPGESEPIGAYTGHERPSGQLDRSERESNGEAPPPPDTDRGRRAPA